MNSAHAADEHDDHNDDGGTLGRTRRRGQLGAAAGTVGYLGTFITDLVRADPADDSVVVGLEIACGVVAAVGFLAMLLVWLVREYARISQEREADSALSVLKIGVDMADAFPRQSTPARSKANGR